LMLASRDPLGRLGKNEDGFLCMPGYIYTANTIRIWADASKPSSLHLIDLIYPLQRFWRIGNLSPLLAQQEQPTSTL
jgi:hypothetical protein